MFITYYLLLKGDTRRSLLISLYPSFGSLIEHPPYQQYNRCGWQGNGPQQPEFIRYAELGGICVKVEELTAENALLYYLVKKTASS